MALTDTVIKHIKSQDKRLKLFDGGGLFLLVNPDGGKYWRLKYYFEGKEKLLALGVYPGIGLREARAKREEAKALLTQGIDPVKRRKEEKALVKAEQITSENTFIKVAQEWFASYSPSLSTKHAARLKRYLEAVLFPLLGTSLVEDIEPADILSAIKPSELLGHITTAHKLKYLCSQVMNYAQITGRVKYNVAAGLSKALQPERPVNLAALTRPDEIRELLRDIWNYEGHPSIVYFLKILPYVFTRPSELRLAQWSEMDFDTGLWRIPASRMKMRREHIVPFSLQVSGLLQELYKFSGNGKYLFPSLRASSATISDAGPLAALRRLGYTKEQMCLHGFRALASTRLNEMGRFSPDVIESQLAHKEPNAIRAAYNRAAYLDERRRMLQEWADYLDGLRGDK
jgi:integrase